MNMRNGIAFILIIVMTILLVGCKHLEPNITFTAQVLNLSEEEYKSVGTKGIENPTIDDFKKMIINFEMNAEGIEERKIKVPDEYTWNEMINSLGDGRFMFGNWTEQLSDERRDAKYSREIVLYSKGLTEQEIRDAFGMAIFEISYSSKEGEEFNQVFIVSEQMEFE
ncbi:hypothetical protein SM124_06640 [Bacillus sp. 31A1R]|uniref:Uncharacterized protein n=1 Tax=Robertmurraya mangrovi TaxID=3098077 RepID=A0ABU5IW88_9BACI|nr:hypothetical protein [Bacillus sp. 31A1R]MDZ5471422.1 hypothetical protein [Bacillus sp. 31A1R]